MCDIISACINKFEVDRVSHGLGAKSQLPQ